MKILILNWRDIKNPLSGGAEILTHEMARRWVKRGHSVTQFSAVFPGCYQHETIDGIKFIRKGKPDIRSFSLPVHFWAFWHYWRNERGEVDVVVDEIHGVPFFTPFFVKEKKVALICEVAQEIWHKMFSFPWNFLGCLSEKIYFKFYRSVPFLTISDSTKKDLVKVGLNEEQITVLPMGITLDLPKKLPEKEKKPTLIFVGRLCAMKGIAGAIEAFDQINKKFPKSHFWIVGDGDKKFVTDLKNLVYQKKLTKKVKFFGFVNEAEKFRLLAKAHVLLHPSVREGWGLVVHEANAVGTPTVAYNSPGLRDIVKDGVNGLLCRKNTPQNMARLTAGLLVNNRLYQSLQKGGRIEVKKANWSKTAKVALKVLLS